LCFRLDIKGKFVFFHGFIHRSRPHPAPVPPTPNNSTPQHPTSENTNIKEESPAKTILGFQYVIYIDSELEHVRKHYFEMKIIGRGGVGTG
jgi:hypothetical protein